MKKRILSVLLSLLMIVSLVPVGVFAEGEEVLTVYADSKAVDYGTEAVTINVYIKNNPGISGLKFSVEYDKDALTLVNATDENSEVRLAATLNPDFSKYPYVVNFYRAANDKSNGILFTMDFELNPEAAPGVYDIDFVVAKDSDVINQTFENVEYAVETASVTILGEDFNSKIKLTDKTVTYNGEVQSLELSGASYLPDEYEVEYFCDGEVFEGAKDIGTYNVEAVLTAPGYNEKTFEATLTINPKALTYSGTVGSREYDGTTNVNFTKNEISGIVEGDDVTVDVVAKMASANVATSVAVVMSFDISGSDAGNYKLPSVPSLKGAITQRAVTVTANGSKKVGDEDPVLEPEILSGSLVEGDEFTGAPSRAAGEQPGVYATKKGTLSLSSNYKLTFSAGEFEIIDKEEQGFEAYIGLYGSDDLTPVTEVEYGTDGTYGVVAVIDEDNCVSNLAETISSVSSDENVVIVNSETGEITIVGAGEAVITVTVPGDDTYKPVEIELPITVTKRAITITADDKVMKLGNDIPELTYTLEGSVVEGDELGINLWVDAEEEIGEYEINVEYTLDNENNYEVTTVNGTLKVIDKLPQNNIEISGEPIEITYGDEGFEFAVETTDGADLLGDVIVETSNPDVLAVDGLSVSVLNAGEATIYITVEGNEDYASYEYERDFTVYKRSITVQAIDCEKYVGQDDPELEYEIIDGSLVEGDEITGSLTRTSGNTAGRSYEIKLGTLTAGGNYDLELYGKAYLKVLPKINQILDLVTVGNFEYGDLGEHFVKVECGDSYNADAEIIITSSNADVAYFNEDGALVINKAGTVKFTASVSGNYMYNDWTKTVTVTVAKKPLTITVDDKSKREGNEDPALTYTATETAIGDTLTVTLERENGETVGEYDIVVTYTLSNKDSYDVTVNNGTFTILDKYPQENISVSGILESVTYGDDDFAVVVETTDGAELLGDVTLETSNSDVLAVDGLNVDVKNAGKATLTLTVKGNEDYADYIYKKEITVAKRKITVSADEITKYAGQDDPELTYTITEGSLVEGDEITGALTRASGNTAGKKYEIKKGTLTAGDNYSVTFVKNYLHVLKKLDQDVAFTAPTSATYGDTGLTWGVVCGEEYNADAPITVVSSNESIVKVNEDGTLTITGVGKAVLTATVPENYKYNPWESKVTLNVAKKAFTIKANDASKKIDNEDPELTYTLEGIEETDDLVVTLEREEGETLGEYDINVTYTMVNEGCYSISVQKGTFTIIDKYPQTITAPEKLELTYGDEAVALEAVSDLEGAVLEYALDSEEVVKFTEDNKLAIVGAGEATVTVSAEGNDDYADATKQIKVTVLPKEVTVTIDAEANEIYYGNEFEYSIKYAGFAYEETAEVLESVADLADTDFKAGNYTLVASGAAAKNYTFTYESYELTVKPAEINVSEIFFYNREFSEGMDKAVDYISIRFTLDNGTMYDSDDVDFEVEAETKTDITAAGTYPVQFTVSITGRDAANFVMVNEGKFGFDSDDYTVEILEVYGANELAGQLENYVKDGAVDGGMGNIMFHEVPENFTITIKDEITDGENVLVDENGNRVADGEGTFDITYVITDTREGGSIAEIVTTVTLLPLDKFNVTAVAENGTVTGAGEYTILDEITLVATPDNKYKFSHWEVYGEKVSTNRTYKFTLLDHMEYGRDLEVAAVFKKSTGTGGGGGGGGSSTTYYYVTFNTDDETSEKVKVEGGKAVTKPEDPVKEGFTFVGWFTDAACTTVYNFNMAVSKSFDLYAQWLADDPDDGKNEGDDGKEDGKDDGKTEEKWTNPFTDVKQDDWFYGAVEYAETKGLFNGVSTTEFAPGLNLTRAMLVTVLYRAEGEPESDENAGFTDVSDDAYYAKAVDWAKANDIVKGVTETEFAPDANITREQIATIMFRYSAYKGMAAVTLEENLHFDDADDISEYAISAMNWAVGTGLMKGRTTSTINPRDNATRAEAATILMRYFGEAAE